MQCLPAGKTQWIARWALEKVLGGGVSHRDQGRFCTEEKKNKAFPAIAEKEKKHDFEMTAICSLGVLSSPLQKKIQSEKIAQPAKLKLRKPGHQAERLFFAARLYNLRLQTRDKIRKTEGGNDEQPLQGNKASRQAVWPARKMWRSDGGKLAGGRICKSALSHARTSSRKLDGVLGTGVEVDVASEAPAWRCTLPDVLLT